MRCRAEGLLLLASLLWGAACRSGLEAAFDREATTPPPVERRAGEPRWSEVGRPEASWVGGGLLLAVERSGRTRLEVLRPEDRELVSIAGESSGQAAVAAGTLVHLVAPGVQPAHRFLEILREGFPGASLVLRPAEGFALLGFAVSAGGRIAWLEFDTRTARSRHLDWRIWVADPERRDARLWVTSAVEGLPKGVAPVPLAWAEATDEILLGGIRLFQALAPAGLYALRSDGTLRQVLEETQYVGSPRVSPGGTHLAWLASDPSALPPDYVRLPGAPPANRLVVRSLASGEEIVVASPPRRVFEAVEWAAADRELLVTARTWQDGRLGDTEILGGPLSESLELRRLWRSSESARVAQVARCESGSLFWIEEVEAKAGPAVSLRSEARPGEPLLSLDEGRMRIVACLEASGVSRAKGSSSRENRG
jgi:hypothetical protein